MLVSVGVIPESTGGVAVIAVVHAKESQVCQRAPIGVRNGRGPGSSEDASVGRRGHHEASTEHQSDQSRPADAPRAKSVCVLSSHQVILPSSKSELAKGNE